MGESLTLIVDHWDLCSPEVLTVNRLWTDDTAGFCEAVCALNPIPMDRRKVLKESLLLDFSAEVIELSSKRDGRGEHLM